MIKNKYNVIYTYIGSKTLGEHIAIIAEKRFFNDDKIKKIVSEIEQNIDLLYTNPLFYPPLNSKKYKNVRAVRFDILLIIYRIYRNTIYILETVFNRSDYA